MRLFPPCPRPNDRIQPTQLDYLESTGRWLCQRKFDGDRAIFKRHEDGTNEIYYGHDAKPFRNWKMPSFLKKELAEIRLPAGQISFLDGELLQSINTIVLFDALQIGKLLLGVRQQARLAMLADVCGNPTTMANPAIALRVSEHIWLAQSWVSGFSRLFSEFKDCDLIEGLLLRKIDSGLDNFGTRPYQVPWQLRVRKPKKNYRY